MLQNQGDAPGPRAQEAFARLLNTTAVKIRARALGRKSVALPADRRAPSSFPSVRPSVPGRAHRTLVNESRKSRVHAQAACAGVCLSAARVLRRQVLRGPPHVPGCSEVSGTRNSTSDPGPGLPGTCQFACEFLSRESFSPLFLVDKRNCASCKIKIH